MTGSCGFSELKKEIIVKLCFNSTDSLSGSRYVCMYIVVAAAFLFFKDIKCLGSKIDSALIDSALNKKIAEFENNVKDSEKVKVQLYSSETAEVAFKLAKDSIEKYKKAVEDSSKTDSTKVAEVIPLVPWNNDIVWDENGEYVLMAYWTSVGTVDSVFTPAFQKNLSDGKPVAFKLINPKLGKLAEKAITSGEWDVDLETFLTAVPQVQNFIGAWIKENELFTDEAKIEADRIKLNFRILQYLGMPPSWSYLFTNRYFVMIWVKPEDLFRPCPNTDVTSKFSYVDYFEKHNQSGLSAKQKSIIEKRKTREQYTLASRISYENNFYKAKLENTYSKDPYPWTRLGYTFDWGNDDSFVGASEFIIRPDASVIVHSVQPTVDFFLTPVPADSGRSIKRSPIRIVTVTSPEMFIRSTPASTK